MGDAMSQMMIDQLAYYAQLFDTKPWIQHKVNTAINTLRALEAHQIPNQPLPQLFFTENQILNEPSLMPLDDLLFDFRQELISSFCIWHLPNQAWIADLHQFIHGRRVLEVMAGNGIITSNLRQLGDDIIATDNFSWQEQGIRLPAPWTQVHKMSAIEAIHAFSFDVIIMSWAPDTDQSDLEILHALRQQNFTGDFIVIGEKNKATNSKGFWQNADLSTPILLNRHHIPFDFIQDQVYSVK